MLVPPNDLQTALVLGSLLQEDDLCSPSRPWLLHPWHHKLSGCSSLALISHNPLGLMEPKKSSLAPASVGHFHQESCAWARNISTPSITQGHAEGTEAALVAPSQQLSPALASRSQAVPAQTAFAPARAPALAWAPQPRSYCACGLNHQASASHCGRPGQVSPRSLLPGC